MSFTYLTEGIVLYKSDFKEADRIYSVFTREHGRRDFVARGSKRISAKLTAHLEPFAESEFMVVHGKRYETVASVERKRAFPSVRTDVTKSILAQQSLHLVHIMTKVGEHDADLYNEIVSWLDFLQTHEEIKPMRADFLLHGFALKIISILGWRPELMQCIDCKKSLAAGGSHFHAGRGGTVCENCKSNDREQWFAAEPISDQVLKLMRFASDNSYEDFMKLHLSSDELEPFSLYVHEVIEMHVPLFHPVCLSANLAI